MTRILQGTLSLIAIALLHSCGQNPKAPVKSTKTTDSIPVTTKIGQEPEKTDSLPPTEKDTLDDFRITTENALQFFLDYEKTIQEDKVEFRTSMGNFTVQLFENVPYHRANMIYLAKRHYFDTTQFHRVVKDFIIQGGNSDDRQVAIKRRKIGRYLLPPDTRKGYKHHRGIISMPSSEQFKSFKRASPYEFFIVVTNPGSYHLDGNYTPFGRVIEGMDVVDKINSVPTDEAEWPMRNVYIYSARAFK